MPFHVCAGSSRLGVAAAGPLAAVRLPQGPRRGVHIPGRAAGGFRPHSRQGQLCPLGTPSRLATRNVFHFYGDSVPKDKDSHPKGALLPLVCMHASDRSGNVRGHQPQTQNSPWSRNGGAGERPSKSASVYLRSPRGRFTYTGEERFSLFRQKDGLTTPLSRLFTHPSALRRGGARPLLEASVRGSRGHRLAGSLLSASRSFRFSRGVSQSALPLTSC